MRVLLLGATENLGKVVVCVRSLSKLQSLVPSTVLCQLSIVVGDATDSTSIEQAIIDNDCDSVVDTAGNQVLPWKEYLLPKIARAVTEAAVEVGLARGRPLRAWL